jgi:hypothetical protein
MADLKTGRLPVAEAIADLFDVAPLPDGFRIRWERHVADAFGNLGVEYLVEGPFPDGVEDGDQVGLMGSHTVEKGILVSITWQWLTHAGKPVGEESVVDLT